MTHALRRPVFRWRIHGQWTDWHAADGPCHQCCHGGGPDAAGRHHEPVEYRAPDGRLEATGHTYYDPADPPELVERAIG